MVVCKHCGKFKRKKVYNRHRKVCIPSTEDLKHKSESSVGQKTYRVKKYEDKSSGR